MGTRLLKLFGMAVTLVFKPLAMRGSVLPEREILLPMRTTRRTTIALYTEGCHILPLDDKPKCLQFIIKCPHCGGRSRLMLFLYDPELKGCGQEDINAVASDVTLLVVDRIEEVRTLAGHCLSCRKPLNARLRFAPPLKK